MRTRSVSLEIWIFTKTLVRPRRKMQGVDIITQKPHVIVKDRLWGLYQELKHFDTLFYSSEEHFISDNLNKVSKRFKIVKGPPIQSLLQNNITLSSTRWYYFVITYI